MPAASFWNGIPRRDVASMGAVRRIDYDGCDKTKKKMKILNSTRRDNEKFVI